MKREESLVEERLSRGLLGSWYVVAKSNDVRLGQPLGVRALGHDLVLWRGDDGKVRCLEDYCPHRGARLSAGRTLGNDISCRYHGVTLDGSGTIVNVPGMAQCPLEGRSALASFAVEDVADGIFVYFPSKQAPQAPPLVLPKEITSGEFTHFLCTSQWKCNYQYVLDNLVDPMHGIFLHGDTFTLGRGIHQDAVEITETDTGFIVKRVAQQQVNFDWAEIVTEGPIMYGRVLIPYPPAAGPGGPMFVIPLVTPVDDQTCRIFFWRTRHTPSEFERESWRFLFRTSLEARHWYVLEQDRDMLERMSDDARHREMLYQHDLGVSRLRRIIVRKARAQIAYEQEATAKVVS